MPEPSKPVPPVYTAGQYSKENVARLLGRIANSIIKAKSRKIKPMDNVYTKLKPLMEHACRKQKKEKCDVKQTLVQPFCVAKIRAWTVPGVENALHIPLDKFVRIWVSDSRGSLVRTDLKRNVYENTKQ